MGFGEAMDSRSLGENGAPELTAKGVGEPLVALFFKLVRALDDDVQPPAQRFYSFATPLQFTLCSMENLVLIL